MCVHVSARARVCVYVCARACATARTYACRLYVYAYVRADVRAYMRACVFAVSACARYVRVRVISVSLYVFAYVFQ